MTRRTTYLLLILMLFSKSYLSAFPTQSHLLPAGTEHFRHSSLNAANNNEATILNISFADDNNEDDDDYGPVFKESLISNTFTSNSFFAKGFLIQQFKNSRFQNDLYSSFPPTYLRLRVIRI